MLSGKDATCASALSHSAVCHIPFLCKCKQNIHGNQMVSLTGWSKVRKLASWQVSKLVIWQTDHLYQTWVVVNSGCSTNGRCKQGYSKTDRFFFWLVLKQEGLLTCTGTGHLEGLEFARCDGVALEQGHAAGNLFALFSVCGVDSCIHFLLVLQAFCRFLRSHSRWALFSFWFGPRPNQTTQRNNRTRCETWQAPKNTATSDPMTHAL